MSQFVFIAIAAGLIAFAATPVTLVVARRIGLVAIPMPARPTACPPPLWVA